MELVHFYFGSSSNLLTKLFLPPLSRDALYSKPHFDKATTVGEPGSGRRVRSIDLQIQTSQDSDFPVPDFLKEIIDELRGLEGFSVELLTESDQDGWTIPIATLANEDGEIDLGLFVETGAN